MICICCHTSRLFRFSVCQCFQFSVVVCGAFPPLTYAFFLGDNNSVGNDVINFLSFSVAPARYVVILCTASPGSRSCENTLQNKHYFIAFFRASMRQAWSVYLVPCARWSGGDKNCLRLALPCLKNAEKCLFCGPSHLGSLIFGLTKVDIDELICLLMTHSMALLTSPI